MDLELEENIIALINKGIIAKFENLKITTMTLILPLLGGVNIEAAFQLFYITRVPVITSGKSTKCKIPHCDTPGSILAMKFFTASRGIIRSQKRPFKNAVTIDISTMRKNVNVKLSANTMQICGAPSIIDGLEAATYIIDHARYVQYILDEIQNDIPQTLEIIAWVLEHSKGEPIEKKVSRMVNKMNIERTLTDHLVTKIEVPIPEHFTKDLATFFMYLCDDFYYHSDLAVKLNFIPNVKTIIEEPLGIKAAVEAMVNYNYNVGFKIDRDRLDRLIDGKYGLVSNYDKNLVHYVAVELPYESSESDVIKRKKNKIPKITFMCYKSGSVTQSGCGGPIMKEAYYTFMKAIHELKPYITLVD